MKIITTITTEELLMSVELDPIRILYGKGTRLWLLNHAYSSNHWKRKAVHDDFLREYARIIAEQPPFPHYPNSTYRVAVGYKRGKNSYDEKKTKTLDIEGIVAIEKIAVDALIQVTGIKDDSIFYIDQTRQKYLGDSADGYEHVILQVTRLIKEEVQIDSERDGIKGSEDRESEHGTMGSDQECSV